MRATGAPQVAWWNRNRTVILFVCGALPFVFIDTPWAHVGCAVYALTGVMFCILLVGEYPPLGSRWFWKSMFPIIALHLLVLSAVTAAILLVPEINKLPRFLYALIGIVGAAEYRISSRILDFFRPKV